MQYSSTGHARLLLLHQEITVKTGGHYPIFKSLTEDLKSNKDMMRFLA